MKTNIYPLLTRIVPLYLLLFCSCNSQQTNGYQNISGSYFKAIGNSDSEKRAEKLKTGEVVVTFDLLPTKMSFNLPSFACMVSENNISYHNHIY